MFSISECPKVTKEMLPADPREGVYAPRINITYDDLGFCLWEVDSLQTNSVTLHFTSKTKHYRSFDVNFEIKQGSGKAVYMYEGGYYLAEEYYITQSGTTCELGVFDTSVFQCLWKNEYSSNTFMQYISVDYNCDGVPNCADGSDETLCNPTGIVYDILHYFFLVLVLGYGAVGCFIHLLRAVRAKPYIRFVETNEVSFDEIRMPFKKLLQNTKTTLSRKNDNILSKEELSPLKDMYHPCQTNVRNKKTLLVIHTLSHHEEFQSPTFQIVDELISEEKKHHEKLSDSLKCLMWNDHVASFLSDWINKVFERNQFFSKLNQGILWFFGATYEYILCKNQMLMFHGKIALIILGGVLKISKLYFDLFRDVSVILTLVYVDTEILQQKYSETRYSTVGGINYKLLVIYFIIITVLSEIWLYIHSIQRTKNIANDFGICPKNQWIRKIIRAFPIHFAVFQQTYLDTSIKRTSIELKQILSKEAGHEEISEEALDKFFSLAQELENNHKHLFLVNKFYRELQTVENCGERELQITAQTILFINSRFFPRILTLFSELIGIPIKYVFGMNWILTLLAISNTIIEFRNSKRYPFSPGLFGKFLQPLVVLALITMKVLFISIALCNAPYFHLLGHILKIFIVYGIFKIWKRGSKLDIFDSVIATSNCSVFFLPTSDILIPKNFMGRYGGILTTFMLESLTYLIYGSLGFLIRFLQQQNIINRMELPPRSYDEDPIQYLLSKLLVDYNVGYIIAFMASSFLLFAIFDYVYYQAGHPKKNTMNPSCGCNLKICTGKKDYDSLQLRTVWYD